MATGALESSQNMRCFTGAVAVGKVQEARTDLPTALRFEPDINEVKMELSKLAEMSKSICYEPSGKDGGKESGRDVKFCKLNQNFFLTSRSPLMYIIKNMGKKEREKSRISNFLFFLNEINRIMLKQGSRVELFDGHAMACTIVCVHRNDQSTPRSQAMLADNEGAIGLNGVSSQRNF
ncbi:hypothetical protein Cgig2_023409 [Carnegiea gigantea]|uniref:Uncharacterized protein n=1 Tax=Carnegiea gigantea TaxID=171969 RepID=A0A9Q1K3Q6_9CARY|nr:hypothetical protein Cgig2_023409 [Carnegiea gigantea]